jgi:arabinofuranosyltransferase
LLARLPPDKVWGIAHLHREIPEGYVETVDSGRNRISDPEVAARYETLARITRGPIWSGPRFRAILKVNLPGPRRVNHNPAW